MRLPILLALPILVGPGLDSIPQAPASAAQASAPKASEPKGAAVAPATYVEQIPTTNVSFEMVFVPGGTFEMGSPADEPGREPDEGPRHAVTVGGFWMGRHEVTWDEYERFAFGANIEHAGQRAALSPERSDA